MTGGIEIEVGFGEAVDRKTNSRVREVKSYVGDFDGR